MKILTLAGVIHHLIPSYHLAFMAVSRRSQALSVGIDKNAWFVNSGATEHMPERKEWFSTFKPIPSGQWSVAVVDDKDIWVIKLVILLIYILKRSF